MSAKLLFTDEQKRIFEFVEKQSGHGIIDAVAGAGKTTTIMECARFVQDQSKILFCAFNNSISSEIAKKFQLLGFFEVTVKTIHALGRQILQDNNSTGQPLKLQENKYKELLKDKNVLDELRPHYETILKINGFEIDEFDERKKFAANSLSNTITSRLVDINQKFRATLTREDVNEFEKLVIHFGIFNDTEARKKDFKQEIVAYFEAHRILLEKGNVLSERTMMIDFTDMLYLPFKWNQQPVKKFEFLFIDECQDLSKSQFAVAAKYGKKDGRILAVGDPRQSIYGFTGADIDSFKRVKDFTKATELPLTTCFRCPKQVIELAKSIRDDIVGNKRDEGVIKTIQFDEIATVAKAGDLIISRLREPLVILVFSFIDKNIKVQISDDEVTEIIGEIKTIFKPNELNIVISNLPDDFYQLKTDVSNRWLLTIEKKAERIIDATERSIYIQNERKALTTKLDFLHKKYEQWKNDCLTINDILRRIKEYISAADNSIKLSTIHRAKGLENDRVFILNYNELPYYRLQQKDWEKIQELNLKYVAVTRALTELYLVESKDLETIGESESLFDNLPFDRI